MPYDVREGYAGGLAVIGMENENSEPKFKFWLGHKSIGKIAG